MDWQQACAYHERGAISTADLMRVAHELFEGDTLEDVLCDLSATHWAAPYPVHAGAPSP